MPRKRFGRNRKNRCRFCTPEGCPKRSGNCAAFQRASSDAVKRARFMALIPYVGE
jgi:small subunit ribosomal protein S18